MRSLDFQRKSEFAEIRQILHSMGKHIIFSSKVIREVCFISIIPSPEILFSCHNLVNKAVCVFVKYCYRYI